MHTLHELGEARKECLGQVPGPAVDKHSSSIAVEVSDRGDDLWHLKAGCGLWFVMSMVDILPDGCVQYDPNSHDLQNMSVMGQLSQTLPSGAKIVVWVLSAPSDSPPGVQSAFTSASHDVIYINAVLESSTWKRKFQHRMLVRDLIVYADWHLSQVGVSPGKQLSSILHVGSLIPLQDQDLLMAAEIIDNSMILESISAAYEWFQSCLLPAAAMAGIISMIMAHLH